MDLKKAALDYHSLPKPGKLSVESSKPCLTQQDLSLAYTPGVAEPVKEININPSTAYKYTNKGNLVAVISDGTAVLGLGNMGALASKPVMEGKAVLFKRFAGIDVFDIEVNAKSSDEFIQTVNHLLENEHNRKQIAGKGIYKIANTFGWDAVADQLLGYLESVKTKTV